MSPIVFLQIENPKVCMLVLLWIRYLWELYLNMRQYEVCKKLESVPDKLASIMKKEVFDLARTNIMNLNRSRYVDLFCTIFISTILILSNLFANVWYYTVNFSPRNTEIVLSCTWAFLLTSLILLITLPFAVFEAFIIRKKYELNVKEVVDFLVKHLKEFLMGQVLSFFIISLTIWVFKYSEASLYTSVWISMCLITFLSLIVYPVYLAPVEYNYRVLPDGDLRTEIENLSSVLSCPLKQLYVAKDIKRLFHSEAFLYGWHQHKCIVLSEVLVGNSEKQGYKTDEIVALVSHEFGHWANNHVIKHVIFGQAYLISMLTIFKLMIRSSWTYRAVGFVDNSHPLLPGLCFVLEYVMEPINSLLTFLYHYVARYHELRADAFVEKLGKARSLETALMKLNDNYVEFPVYDRLFSMWYHSRPTLLERLDALE